jgi:hypothetical protein
MIKPLALTTMMLFVSAGSSFAQGGNPPSAPPAQGQQPIIGQTGTMYDGNNANLQSAPQQNAYWAQLWAQPSASGNSGPASAVGAGAAGTSLGGTTGGGEH